MLNAVALAVFSKCCSLSVCGMPSDLHILYLFLATLRLPSRDRFGQTEPGLNVWGGVGGRMSFVARALRGLL